MALLVGDDTGLLKQIRLADKQVLHSFGVQSPERSIQHMLLDDNNVYTILKSGSLETCDLLSGAIKSSVEFTTDECTGFDLFRATSARKFISCTKNGLVEYHSFGQGCARIGEPLKVGSDVFRMRLERKSQQLFATGGKGEANFLKVWDVETGKQIWRCRNVAHDMLNLSVPFWINDLQFSPQEESKLLTGTAHHEIKLYDTRDKTRRPVLDIKNNYKAAVQCVSFSPDANYIFAGDSKGGLGRYDIRQGRMVSGYHGTSGSVRSLHVHPTLPFVATCGLDRFARVYNVQSKQVVHQVYLKQKLNCVLFCDEEEHANRADESDELEEESDVEIEPEKDEDDELWEELEEKRQAKLEQKMVQSYTSTDKRVKKNKHTKRKFEEAQRSDAIAESTESENTQKKKKKKQKRNE